MVDTRWYVVHTYSGYENKVALNIEKMVENRGMQDQIMEVRVPTEWVTEIKDGKEREVERKVYPSYVLVKCAVYTDDGGRIKMGDAAWYVIRNTRGVTGFVGPGSKPVPLTAEELVNLGISAPDSAKPEEKQLPAIDIHVGEEIRIIQGPFEGFEGLIDELQVDKRKLKVNISIFGRETPVELDFTDIEKI